VLSRRSTTAAADRRVADRLPEDVTAMLRSLLPSRRGLVLALAALLLPGAIAWASTVVSYTAVGQTMVNGQSASNPSAASRDWSRVYRPVGNFFDIAYLNSGGSFQGPIHSNAGSNPFVDGTSAFFARAWCRNSAGVTVASVTCQTTTP
jgi:uncharacterized membrane protein